ncbi:MAG: hypothetical protein ABJ308_14400 [Halieaceae bacterium]
MAKGSYNAPGEKSFERILSPLEEFIHRQTTSRVLLMAKTGILLASALAGLGGFFWLLITSSANTDNA